MPGQAELLEVIPLVVRLLGGARLLSRLESIFPFAVPMSEPDALKRLDDANKTKTKTKREDNKHVVKVNDAIRAVEDTFRSGHFLYAALKGILRSLVGGESIPDSLVAEIADKIRARALQQNNPERARQNPGRTRK